MGEIIPDYLYSTVYLLVVFMLICFKMISPKRLIAKEDPATSVIYTWVVGIFFIIFFGTRPTEGLYMADTANYVGGYEAIRFGRRFIEYNWENRSEILWTILLSKMAVADFSVWAWMTVVATIYIAANIFGIRRMFPNHTYVVFLSYVSFFLFYSGGINGIRNADAYSLVFWGIALYNTDVKFKYVWITILCILGYYIHTSVIILISAFVLSVFVVKKTKTALIIWFFAIFMSLVAGNYLAGFAAGMFDDRRAAGYLQTGMILSEKTEEVIRYRWDFLLFSAVPIFIGYYVTVKRKIKDKFYQILLNTYILANAVWIVFMYAAFTNRFAMLSWCIYPYVLCYPFLKLNMWPLKKQNGYFKFLYWVMFLFTIYMV